MTFVVAVVSVREIGLVDVAFFDFFLEASDHFFVLFLLGVGSGFGSGK